MLSIAAPQVELFGVSPALFVENQGQWADEALRFVHEGDGAAVAMTDEGILFEVARSEQIDGEDSVTHTLEFSAEFVGANVVMPVGLEQSETVFNYFVGDEASWHAGVSSYEVVAYQGLYGGIDLHTFGQRDSLKYEFHVAPGADWSAIAVHYDGIAGLSVAEDASLVVDLGGDWGRLVDDAPYVYQVIDGQEVEVAAQFVLLDATTYTFAITGGYDPTVELVIDPDVAWSTYLGGSGSDVGLGIALDASGNVLVTGQTYSTDFAGGTNTNHGSIDAFVAKVTPSGSVAWMTYLGGNSYDAGAAIALDASGNILVTGYSWSTDFAGGTNTNHGSMDAFVAKVTWSGSLAWTTYLGGSDADVGIDLALDASGNTLVTGYSWSTDFAGATNTNHGDRDAFVAKVTAGGSLAWATYLGGSGSEIGYGIALDASGNTLVTGDTSSTDFAGAANTNYADKDAFVAKITPSGSLAWATYLGGSGEDDARGIALDASGNTLVTGLTYSTDFAGATNTNHGFVDVFVAKITPSGSLAWATYLGGSRSELGNDIGTGIAIALDASGNALVTGATRSMDFAGSINKYYGDRDAFVAKVTPSGLLAWAMYLGGSGSDCGNGIALDASGNVLVSGDTKSMDFAGANNTYYGEADGFLAKISGIDLPWLLGDANGDGWVDTADAARLALNWRQDGKDWADGDFNGDGRVDERDASILASHWHQVAPGALLGDANVDGVVDAADAAILAINWRKENCAWLDGDFNGDGRVDERDASILASHWGMSAKELTPALRSEVVEIEPVVMPVTRIIGPRPMATAPATRRLLEPVRPVESAAPATIAAAHDAVLAAANLPYQDVAQTEHRRSLLKRPNVSEQTLDLVLAGYDG